MRNRRYQFLAAVAFATGALSLLVATAPPARAASFTVDSTVDATDANPGDGVCDDGAGNCTMAGRSAEKRRI